jgi:hypothetical protein
MSNKLNFSSINDAWGLPPEELDDEEPLTNKFNYQKPKENILTINSNEIVKPIRQEYKPIQETFTEYIKPCSLFDEHIKKCELCRNKLIKNSQNTNFHNTREHMTSNIIETYNNFDLNESFENISPSQKNLIIVILYGFLIILISDLIIKE